MKLTDGQRLAEGYLLNWMGEFDVVVPTNAFKELRDKLAAAVPVVHRAAGQEPRLKRIGYATLHRDTVISVRLDDATPTDFIDGYSGKDVYVLAAPLPRASDAAAQGDERELTAWESTTPAYRKYITDSTYQRFSPEVRKWYKPYRCAACVSAPLRHATDAAAPVKAWATDDDRVISDSQKQAALREGGANASAVRPFSIALREITAPQEVAETTQDIAEAADHIAHERKLVARVDGRAALPRYTEWLHLREHGEWSDGVPDWAKDYSGRMNDFTAATAVIEELAAARATAPQAEQRLSDAAHAEGDRSPIDGDRPHPYVWRDTGALETGEVPDAN
jgi:hypothetical protein